MATGMTPAKRFIIRTALVAGSSLATIIGAQNLILLDNASSNAAISATVSSTTSVTTDSLNSDTTAISTVRAANTDTSSTSSVALVPTAQSGQQVVLPSIPTTRSSR